MQAGKHVIVEKPIALSLADADRMIAAAERAGRKLCVVLQNRYNPPMQEMKRAVERDGWASSCWATPRCAGTGRRNITRMSGMARGRWTAAR